MIKFVILEDGIPYDFDDFDLWGAVLFDIENNEIVTSKYGHGQDMAERSSSVELDYAIENNLVSIETMIDAAVNELGIKRFPDIEEYAAHHSKEYPMCVPVNVVKGRKFKGEGYLIYAEKSQVMYGWGRYHNEYDYYPIIFSPKTKTFERVNSFGYLEFSEETKTLAKETIRENITNTKETLLRLSHCFAYKMSYSASDSRYLIKIINDYALLGLKAFFVIDEVKEAIKNEEIKKQEAFNNFKNEKMPQLIEWVKNNTDRKGEEIEKLAEHIFNKKYA